MPIRWLPTACALARLEALDHGIMPGLSPDVGTNMTTDPFSLMRGTFTPYRAHARIAPMFRTVLSIHGIRTRGEAATTGMKS